MGRIAVSALKPGMLLDSEVSNDRRQSLATAGTVVDERLIRVLRTWGIVEADVQVWIRLRSKR